MRGDRRRALQFTVTLIALTVLVTACAHTDRRPERAVFGRVISTLPPSTTAPAPFLRGTKDYDGLVRSTVTDLQQYWSSEFGNLYEGTYRPVRKFFAYGSRTRIPSCDGFSAPYLLVQNNAFYCQEDDFIAWDDENLFPDLEKDFGRFAIALVLAHEWGHAIQQRADVSEETVIMEQQADCFAGAWSGHLAQDSASARVVGFAPGDLDVALAGLVRFRDFNGATADTLGSHGTGFDRVRAFQEGYAQGAGECARYVEEPPQLVGIPFKTLENRLFGGDAPFSKVVPRVAKNLDSYWKAKGVPALTVRRGRPSCASPIGVGGLTTAELGYCAATKTVTYDEAAMRRLYDDFGDFAIATVLGETWVIAAAGHEDGSPPKRSTVLCRTGTWARSVFDRTLQDDGGDQKGELTLSPGDLDETVQWLLRRRTAARIASPAPAVAFDLVDAFRIGFTDPSTPCA